MSALPRGDLNRNKVVRLIEATLSAFVPFAQPVATDYDQDDIALRPPRL